MGLFNFGRKKEEKKEFQSKIVLCENVNEELLKVSKEYDIPLSKLDFNILSYKTYIKFPDMDFVEADEETINKFINEDILLDENAEIKQVYEIEIIKYKPKNNFEILGEMKVNKLYTNAEFILSKKSVIRINDIYNQVKNELNKKKLRNSLLINIFDLMDEDIKKLQSIILIDEKLNNDFKIRLCKGVNPIKSVKGKVIFHFKNNVEKNKKVLLYPVRKDDILIEIILPKEGRNGRDCRGKIIKIEKPDDFKPPQIIIDEKTILKEKNEEKIVFIAKKDGYIVKDDGKFIIKDEMEVKQINIKTGNVTNADKSEVKLYVKESDVLKEAIADNMTVETTELNVKGNVGNKAKIKAKKLEIHGQTHQNSKILAKNAFINVHKGFIKGEKVKIKRLEGGRVKADYVEIEMALGGEVYAKNIKINNFLSHNKLFASEKIIVCNIKGEENILSISPKKVLDSINIEELEKKKVQIEQFINIKTREYKRLKEIYLENKFAINEYKKIYLENKKKNIKTSPTILKKLKEFKELSDKVEKFQNEIKLLKKEKEGILQTIDYLQNGVYNAKILANSEWRPFNRIVFELIEPPLKFVYDTKEDEGKCGFKLKFTEDISRIVKIKVENDLCN